jgi:hypothetical protein
MKHEINDYDIAMFILIVGFIIAIWNFLVCGSIFQFILVFVFTGCYPALPFYVVNAGGVDENKDYPVIDKLEKNQYVWGW